MYSPLSTAIGIKKMRFLSGKQQRWYIYIVGFYYILLFYLLGTICSIYLLLPTKLQFQPNQWSYPRQVAGRQVALVQRWIATHCADHNRNGHREYGDANVLWSRARRGQFSSLAKQWKFWNGGHGEKKKKQTIPTRDPKQCVVRILKWKVERTENHQWLAGPERP